MKVRCVALLFFIATAVVGFAETPREFAHRFCRAERRFGFRGLPDKQWEPMYDRLIGLELIGTIPAANSALARWTDRHRSPLDQRLMIPHFEENLFSGFSEGPTTFAIGRVVSRSGKVAVEVYREYSERMTTRAWTDVLILDQSSGGWVVADIESHYCGSLLGQITNFTKQVDAEKPDAKPTGANMLLESSAGGYGAAFLVSPHYHVL